MLSLPFSLLFIGSIIVCIIKSYFRDIIIQMNGIGPHGRWDETSRPLCSPYCCISLGRCVFARVHMIHKQTLAHPCSCSKYAPYFSLHFLARIERKKCQFLCVYSSFRFWAVSEGIIAFGEHGNVQQKWIYAWHNKLENYVSFDVCVCLCTKNDVTRKIYLWLFEQSKKNAYKWTKLQFWCIWSGTIRIMYICESDSTIFLFSSQKLTFFVFSFIPQSIT